MAHAAVPGVEQIGETVIDGACDWLDERQTDEPGEPGVARREPPDGDGAIGADVETAVSVDRMQAAAHVFETGAEARQRVRLEIDARNSMMPARAASTKRLRCQSMPALQTGHLVL
jgi:hypothetical protein